MRKWIVVINVLTLIVIIWVFPLWTKTYGAQDIRSGSTPPIGVERNGTARFITNWNHVGIIVLIQGSFVIVYQKTGKKSQ